MLHDSRAWVSPHCSLQPARDCLEASLPRGLRFGSFWPSWLWTLRHLATLLSRQKGTGVTHALLQGFCFCYVRNSAAPGLGFMTLIFQEETQPRAGTGKPPLLPPALPDSPGHRRCPSHSREQPPPGPGRAKELHTSRAPGASSVVPQAAGGGSLCPQARGLQLRGGPRRGPAPVRRRRGSATPRLHCKSRQRRAEEQGNAVLQDPMEAQPWCRAQEGLMDAVDTHTPISGVNIYEGYQTFTLQGPSQALANEGFGGAPLREGHVTTGRLSSPRKTSLPPGLRRLGARCALIRAGTSAWPLTASFPQTVTSPDGRAADTPGWRGDSLAPGVPGPELTPPRSPVQPQPGGADGQSWRSPGTRQATTVSGTLSALQRVSARGEGKRRYGKAWRWCSRQGRLFLNQLLTATEPSPRRPFQEQEPSGSHDRGPAWFSVGSPHPQAPDSWTDVPASKPAGAAPLPLVRTLHCPYRPSPARVQGSCSHRPLGTHPHSASTPCPLPGPRKGPELPAGCTAPARARLLSGVTAAPWLGCGQSCNE